MNKVEGGKEEGEEEGREEEEGLVLGFMAVGRGYVLCGWVCVQVYECDEI